MTDMKETLRRALGPLRGRAGWGAVAAMAALGVVLCALPLTNILGYEASAVVGMVAPLVAAGLWLGDGRRWVRWRPVEGEAPPEAGVRPYEVWARMAGAGLLLLVPPLLLLALNALRVRNCDPVGGLVFYAVIAAPSVWIAALWALLATILAERRWARWGVFVGLYAASVAGAGLFMALEPPIVTLHPLMGYFAGSIYDEALMVPPKLLLYRAWNGAVIVAALLGLEVAWCRRRGEPVGWVRGGALVAALLAAVAVYAARAPLGMEIDRGHLEEELGVRHETEHFVIHVRPGTWHAEQVEAIGEDHEFRYHQLRSLYGRAPLPEGERIRSYVYPSAKVKGRLMGGRRTMVAKLWLGEMHILYPNLGYPVLTHELSHVFSRPFGAGPMDLSVRFGVLPNMGLVEGLAEATSWRRRELSLHEWSAAMRRLDIAPDIRSLVGAEGFYVSSSSKAYALMGSFASYLIERYGVERFLAAYPRADFEGAYGRPVGELVAEWEGFVDGQALQDEVLPLAEFYFDRKSIFTKVCARTIAALRDEARDLSARRRLDEALSCYSQIVEFNPESAPYRLQLAAALRDAERLEEALAQVDAALGVRKLPAVQRARAMRERGDLKWLKGDAEGAAADYRAGLGEALPWGTRRALAARLEAIEGGDGRSRELARSFLLGRDRERALYDVTSWAWRAPGSGLASYLVGRQLWTRHACAEATPWLERSLEAERALPDVAVRMEALRLLGICRLREGDLDGARGAFEAIAAADVPGGIQVEARDWLERVEWRRGR